MSEKELTEDQVIHEDVASESQDSVAGSPISADSDDGRDWYVLQCFTGHEKKVQSRIEQLVSDQNLEDQVFRVLVPEEDIIEIKNNKRIEKKVRIFPGYCFVQMILSDDVAFALRRLPGVAKFIGSKSSPTPVRESEILKVLRKVGDKTKKIDVDFEVGEVIKVVSGPFRGYSGEISEINADRGKLKSLIEIFGRETPVELDFDQVEKSVS